MSEKTLIHLVRHGIVHNPDGIYYGRLQGFRLGKKGFEHAKAAAMVLNQFPIAAIYSSPMERAIETAEEIQRKLDGLKIQRSELLSEAYTPFDGQPIIEIEKRNWDVYTGTNPPYEQPMDILARVNKFIEKIRREHNGRQVAAATHGDVIAFMILYAMGKPITSNVSTNVCVHVGSINIGNIISTN